MLRAAVGDELVGCREGVEEATARRLHIKRAALGAKGMLNEIRGGGEGVVATDGRDDDQAEILAFDACALKSLPGRGDGECRGRITRTGEMALLDARAGGDPLVGGIDHALKIR